MKKKPKDFYIVIGDDTSKERALTLCRIKKKDALVFHTPQLTLTSLYDSLIKTILITAYHHDIRRVTLVQDVHLEKRMDDPFFHWLQQQGIKKETIQLLNYVHQSEGITVDEWLKSGNSLLETVLILQKHPLLPKTISFQGFLMGNNLTPLSS
ncbi:hypothetical protein [Desmospora profundinema]|uniref:Uncharacterized protein n=1 Tax=Desmospora profundinema TaxID=1571184 RepID=A0ABU1INW9_9BACL|nr:hypothetical protein [Desmospora profundinema]MDR6226489.1 hypothetical protein [Desmospora profundinema]